MISQKEFGDEIERLHNAKNNLSMTPEGRRKIVNLAQSWFALWQTDHKGLDLNDLKSIVDMSIREGSKIVPPYSEFSALASRLKRKVVVKTQCYRCHGSGFITGVRHIEGYGEPDYCFRCLCENGDNKGDSIPRWHKDLNQEYKLHWMNCTDTERMKRDGRVVEVTEIEFDNIIKTF